MANRIKLEGYDLFIGRCIEYSVWNKFEYEKEYFVALEKNGDLTILKSLDVALECLCHYAKLERKILLNENPGIIREGFLYRKIKQFEPFTPEEMSELEQKYELRLDLKLRRNPFLYQPEKEEVKY